ncbi:hypothetical protein OFN42_33190, partial [Escherichia coli]|nr:hypothetical protein [Escherichia coli]
GEYFKVFTPFKRAWLQKFSLPTVSKPQRQNELPSEQLEAVKQDGFDDDFTFSYPRESSEAWCASTNDILKQLRTFARERSDGYQMKRDFP